MKILFLLPRLILPALLLMAGVAGCRGGGECRIGEEDRAPEAEQEFTAVALADLTEEAREWADSMLRTLTLEQRAGQLLMPALYASSDPATFRRLRSYAADMHIGGIVLLKGDVESSRILSDTLRSLSPVAPFVAMDAEWGPGMRLSGMPVFPDNGSISRDADQGVLYEYGREVARECRMAGVNMVLGPVADVAGQGSMIGRRSFGSDPRRVAELTVAYGRGLEDGDVLSVAKHFPGHGSPRQDSHRGVAVIRSSRRELDSIDLPPFRAYVEAGLSGIMSGHLAVPALDSLCRPASFSPAVLTGLLREELGFRGLVLTDALNMGGARGYTAADALRAGADIVLVPADTEAELRVILSEAASGKLPASVISDRCRRVLFHKYLLEGPEGRGRVSGLHLPAGDRSGSRADSLRRLLRGVREK